MRGDRLVTLSKGGVDAGDRSFDQESHAGNLLVVAERERGNLSERTKAGGGTSTQRGKGYRPAVPENQLAEG